MCEYCNEYKRFRTTNSGENKHSLTHKLTRAHRGCRTNNSADPSRTEIHKSKITQILSIYYNTADDIIHFAN